MKKFHFKLSPLLKIKELEKIKLEYELSKLNNDIRKREDETSFNQKDISHFLESAHQKGQINLLSGPDFILSRKINIKLLKSEIENIFQEREMLLKKIAKVTREIDKIEEIKSEKMNAWKKLLSKKELADLEEESIVRGYYAVDGK